MDEPTPGLDEGEASRDRISAWRKQFVGSHSFAPPRGTGEEAVAGYLIAKLERHGWQCQREVELDSGRFRADVLIRHPLLPWAGVVECKAQIKEVGQATAALKQASDYIGRHIHGGEFVRFAAVCPWQPPAEAHCGTGCAMWGMLHIMAHQFKVFAFASDETVRRYEQAKGKRNLLRFDGDRLLLLRNQEARVWCSKEGFVANAAHVLGGKRQIGGARE